MSQSATISMPRPARPRGRGDRLSNGTWRAERSCVFQSLGAVDVGVRHAEPQGDPRDPGECGNVVRTWGLVGTAAEFDGTVRRHTSARHQEPLPRARQMSYVARAVSTCVQQKQIGKTCLATTPPTVKYALP